VFVDFWRFFWMLYVILIIALLAGHCSSAETNIGGYYERSTVINMLLTTCPQNEFIWIWKKCCLVQYFCMIGHTFDNSLESKWQFFFHALAFISRVCWLLFFALFVLFSFYKFIRELYVAHTPSCCSAAKLTDCYFATNISCYSRLLWQKILLCDVELCRYLLVGICALW